MSEPTKAELAEKAKELDIEGRSKLSKDELAEAVAKAEAEAGKGDAPISEADPASTTPYEEAEGEEPVGVYDADKVAEAEAKSVSPFLYESPEVRVMTGAVSEADAKEQEKVLADLPEDAVGDVSETGVPVEGGSSDDVDEESLSLKEKARLGLVKQEDIIDFPPPVGVREEQAKAEAEADEDADEDDESAPQFAAEQKAVLQTDGTGGANEQNLEHAYKIPEKLKSNDDEQREAGEISDSEESAE